MSFDQRAIRAQAERFGVDVFRRRFVELFERLGVDPSLYRRVDGSGSSGLRVDLGR